MFGLFRSCKCRVFFRNLFVVIIERLRQPHKYFQVIVASIIKYVLTQSFIFFESIIVEVLHIFRYSLIVFYVFIHLSHHSRHIVAKCLGIDNTLIATFFLRLVEHKRIFAVGKSYTIQALEHHIDACGVYLQFFIATQTLFFVLQGLHLERRWQFFESVDEQIVALYLATHHLAYLIVWQSRHFGAFIYVGSLLASISHIEGKTFLLRVENKRYLITFLHGEYELVVLSLCTLFIRSHYHFLLQIILLQFGSEHIECLLKILFLEHSLRRHSHHQRSEHYRYA